MVSDTPTPIASPTSPASEGDGQDGFGTVEAPPVSEEHHPTEQLFPLVTFPEYPEVLDWYWDDLDSVRDCRAKARVAQLEGRPEPRITIDEEDYCMVFRNFCKVNFSKLRLEAADIIAWRLWKDDTSYTGYVDHATFRRRLQIQSLKWNPTRGGNIEEHLKEALEYMTTPCQDQSPLAAVSDEVVPRKYAFLEYDQVETLPNAGAMQEDSPVLDFLYTEDDALAQSAKLPAACRVLVLGDFDPYNCVSEELARQLNAVHITASDMALREVLSGSEMGQELQRHVEQNTPIGLQLQAAVIAKALASEDVKYCGYVYGDLPPFPATADGDKMLAEWIEGCKMALRPGQVVSIRCPDSISPGDEWLRKYEHIMARQAEEAREEMRLREKEDAEERERRAKEEAKAAREARRKEREEKGEEPDPADQEEEEEAVLDDEGNPMEPEEVKRQQDAKLGAMRRRRLKFDLQRLISEGRAVAFHGNDDERTLEGDEPRLDPATHAELSQIIEAALAIGTYVETLCHDTAERQATLFLQHLPSLQPRRGPVLVEPPVQPAEEDNADEDAQGEAFLEELLAAGNSLSNWGKVCPVTYADTGVHVEGHPFFAVTYQRHIFLFTSRDRQHRFAANPDPFLVEHPRLVNQPFLILKYEHNLLEGLGIDEAKFSEALSSSMKYTPVDLATYHRRWKEYLVEQKELHDQEERRRKEEEERLQREEEERKAKEKKAKGKKKKEEAAKEPKKKVEKKAEEVASEVQEEAQEPPPPKKLTLAERKQQEVEAAVARARDAPSLFVHAVSVTESELEYLYEKRLLPEVIVVLDNRVPRPEGGEEEEQPEEEEADEDAPPPAYNANDPKHHRALVERLVEKYQADSEAQEEPPPPPEDEEEGAPPPPPPKQKLKVVIANIANAKSMQEAVYMLRYQIDPFIPKATVAEAAEEEAEAEGEEDERAKPENPLLVPGMKAIHHFGRTLKWCPVSYRLNHMLVKGNPEIAALYKSKRWIFRNEAARDVFLLSPHHFEPSLPAKIPPPRLWIIGAPYSGKTSLSSELRKLHGVEVVQYDPEAMTRRVRELVQDTPDCPHLQEAVKVITELEEFDLKQEEMKKAKEELQKRMEEKEEGGEEEEEEEGVDNELLEWEPEDDDARVERLRKKHISLLKHLVLAEPYASNGYVIDSLPVKDSATMEALLEEDVIPELVVHLKVTQDIYVRRAAPHELSRRRAEYEEKVARLKAKKLENERRARAVELARWRRRNIGQNDDVDEAEGGEEEEEEPVEPTKDEVEADLISMFEEWSGGVEAFGTLVEEKLIDIITVSADNSLNTVLHDASVVLQPNLNHRPSLFDVPYLETAEKALDLIRDGKCVMSSFGRVDPVGLHDRRSKKARKYKILSDKAMYMYEKGDEEDAEEEEEVSPARGGEEGEEEGEGGGEEEEGEEEVGIEDLPDEEMEELRKAEEERVARRRAQPCVAIFHSRVYYFDTPETFLRFAAHPWHHLQQPPPPPKGISTDATRVFTSGGMPVTAYEAPILASVLSPSEDVARRPRGRRSLAEQVAANIDAVHVSLAKLVKDCALSETRIGAEVRQVLLNHGSMSDSVVARMLALRLSKTDVQQRGCVLDGFPYSTSQAEAINEAIAGHNCLHKVFVVQHMSPSGPQLEEWQSAVMSLYDELYRNTVLVEHDDQFAQLVTITDSLYANEAQRQKLAHHRLRGMPAPLHDTTQLVSQLYERQSQYSHYCPVEWVKSKVLVSTEGDGVPCYAVECCGKVYNFSSKENLSEFLDCPTVYVDREGQYRLPSELPKRMPLQKAKQILDRTQDTPDWNQENLTKWECLGLCPVTLYYTRDNIGLKGEKTPIAVNGLNQYAVEYQKKYYRMASAEYCNDFLREPWVFTSGAVLPKKLPIPRHFLLQSKQVNLDVYMEHTVHESVVRAMLAVADFRPKYPGLSSKRSAMKFIALHMKAHNPNNTPLKAMKYRQNFKEFIEACGLYDYFTTTDKESVEPEEWKRKTELWDKVQGRHLDPDRYISLNLDD